MKMKKLRIAGIALSLLLLLPAVVFSGGGGEKAVQSNTVSSGPTTFGLKPFEQKQILRVGYFAGSPLSLPFYIADKEGFFRELNIELVYETFTNGPAMMEANADWDIAGCGEGGALVGLVGYDMHVIGISDYEENMALFAKPGSKLAQDKNNPANWRGTQWLYPMGPTGQAVLAAGLGKVGLSLQDVRSVNMDVVSALTGFQSQGDGLAVWNAIAFAAEDRGYVRLEDASTLKITFPCVTLASEAAIRNKLDLITYAYIIFYKTWEWCNQSPQNMQKGADYYLENCLDEGVACDENIAKRVMEWYRAPFLKKSVEIMTQTSPDDARLYAKRNLKQAEKDILVGMDFFIAENRYKPEDRVKVLDMGLVDDTIALRAQAICAEQGMTF
jgi:ABC-type nitrate/sulfonate/bicarbonate transport system substrate-binding protein